MRLIPVLLLVCFGLAEAKTPANWSANYPPCNRHTELLKQGHMDLGVRVATANPSLAKQFRRAMDFWARITSTWTGTKTIRKNCSMQLVDGERKLFQPSAVVARSQLPDRLNFQGWIAFNPAQTLSETDLYRISVHEIGHMLGLQHSFNSTSVMYGLDLDGVEWLDPADLAALAAHHKLRIASLNKPIKLARQP